MTLYKTLLAGKHNKYRIEKLIYQDSLIPGMAESLLGGAVEFFRQVGFYDVILPFLLVFALVYAVFEKTKVLGENKSNISSLVAFVIGIIVIGTTKLVAVINEAIANVTLVLIIATFFLITVSVFLQKDQYDITKNKTVWGWLIALIAVVVLAIFFQALGWNVKIWEFLKTYGTTSGVAAIIFLIAIGIFMWIIVKEPSSGGGSGKGGSSN